MGDVIVDVPGGSNNHNYANVTLIVELARLHGVHAVWAGWGHASENPILPDTLAKSSNPPIKFIGPAGPPMRALGDKIGSTIIAQTAGVRCIAWNGDDVRAEYDRETGCLPDSSYQAAIITNATEALEAATKIGFPIMIKASEGGGGKGIRMVDSAENVQTAYRQVCGEVPGSPIFIMKLSSKSRHLEVQLLADEYGDAVALNGRDCSVQRRHQKVSLTIIIIGVVHCMFCSGLQPTSLTVLIVDTLSPPPHPIKSFVSRLSKKVLPSRLRQIFGTRWKRRLLPSPRL